MRHDGRSAFGAMRAAEERLLARRAAPADPIGAAEEALATAWGSPAAPPPDALRLAARRLGEAVAAHGASFPPGAEPAYHNRHHQAEATLAAGWLAAAARRAGRLSPAAAALLVVAMAGHDLHHPGLVAEPGTLERRSADAAAAAVGDALAPAERAELRRVILLTNPSARCAPDDLPGRLAREADLFASLLPTLGPRLSEALSRELRACGEADAARAVGGHRGRVALLRRAGDFTEAAAALGLAGARALQLAALLRAAPGAESPEAAASRLDRMEAVEAGRLWAEALGAAQLAARAG